MKPTERQRESVGTYAVVGCCVVLVAMVLLAPFIAPCSWWGWAPVSTIPGRCLAQYLNGGTPR